MVFSQISSPKYEHDKLTSFYQQEVNNLFDETKQGYVDNRQHAVLLMSNAELGVESPYKKLFEDLLRYEYHINTSYELRAYLEKKAIEQGVGYVKIATAFQGYLNKLAKVLKKSKKVLIKNLITSKIWYTDDQYIKIDGDIGPGTINAMNTIRNCRFLNGGEDEHTFSGKTKELFHKKFDIFLEVGIIHSIDDIIHLLSRNVTHGKDSDRQVSISSIKRFTNKLNVEAKKYGLTSVNTDDQITDEHVKLLQKVRLQYTLKQVDDIGIMETIENNIIRFIGLDHNASYPDFFGMKRDELRGEDFKGFDMNFSGIWEKAKEYKLKIWDGQGTLLERLQALLELKDEKFSKWFKIKYRHTLCVISTVKNFEKLGIDLNHDYPIMHEYDPKFREDIIDYRRSQNILTKDSDLQRRYFADKPEYYKGYPLQGIPKEKLDDYITYIKGKIYDVFYQAQPNMFDKDANRQGVAMPLLLDTGYNKGHSIICYLDKLGAIRIADSYYMDNGWTGSLDDFIKKFRESKQGKSLPEGVLMIPQFAYEMGPRMTE